MGKASRVSLNLPYPPTVNHLFAGKARRYKSPEYKAWQAKACQHLSGAPFLTGRLFATYTFTRPDKRKRDLGNLEKAVSDILAKTSVIEDDSKLDRITLQWGETELGCHVLLEAHEPRVGG